MGCNCCDEPIWRLYVKESFGSGASDSGTTYLSAGSAWAAAVGALSGYSPGGQSPAGFIAVDAFGGVEASGEKRWTTTDYLTFHWQAALDVAKFQFYFYTATCYFKIWWDEVSEIEDGSGPVTTPREWEWTATSVSGLCLPVDFVNQLSLPAITTTDFDDIVLTWPSSDEFELGASTVEPPDPNPSLSFPEMSGGARKDVSILNLRWSVVPGWEPSDPDDPFPHP